MLAFGRQLRSFTRALQSVTSVPDLLVFMDEALSFLEAKFDASIVFVHDLQSAEHQSEDTSLRHGAAPPQVLAALEAAYARGVSSFTLQPGGVWGCLASSYLGSSRNTSCSWESPRVPDFCSCIRHRLSIGTG